MDRTAFIQAEVLPAFPRLDGAAVAPLGGGLINETFLVEADRRRFVLQRLAPIFPIAVNDNVAAVTEALARAGLSTPRLVLTRDRRPALDLGSDGGVWRLQTYVDGVCFDRVQSPAQARCSQPTPSRGPPPAGASFGRR